MTDEKNPARGFSRRPGPCGFGVRRAVELT